MPATKTIKVTLPTYELLEQIREKGETFNQVVERLITVFQTIKVSAAQLGLIHNPRTGIQERFARGIAATGH